MSESLDKLLGPAPFRFQPLEPGRSVRAFSLTFRLLALAMLLAGSLWMFSLWREGALGSGESSGLSWFAAGLALMFFTVWHIWTSRTRLDADSIHQSWLWDKQMELRELAYAKLIRIPGLDWLIAPRLYARTLAGKFAVFYAADSTMLSDFERLVRELRDFRTLG
jgi:hypothetical protein